MPALLEIWLKASSKKTHVHALDNRSKTRHRSANTHASKAIFSNRRI